MILIRSRVTAGVIAVIGVVVAGCNSSADGSAQSLLPSSKASSTEQQDPTPSGEDDTDAEDLPQNGAPTVEHPLDASMLEDDLCAAITKEQAKRFPGELQGSEIGDKGYCDWTYDNDLWHVGFIGGRIMTENHKGLTKYYGPIDDDVAEANPVDPVNGYPAVHFDLGKTDEGTCSIIVGLRDDLTYDVLVTLESEHPSYDEPCKVARKFAETVVDNLKEAQ